MNNDKLICKTCKKNVAGDFKKIKFYHKEIKFSVFKDKDICIYCKRKAVAKKFDEYGSNIIKVTEEKVVVDWGKYIKEYEKEAECRGAGISISAYKSILLDIGILSFESRGNWEMDIIGMSPFSNGGGHLYFTRKEDILEYARLRYADTSYNWVVRRIGEIISKAEVIGI